MALLILQTDLPSDFVTRLLSVLLRGEKVTMNLANLLAKRNCNKLIDNVTITVRLSEYHVTAPPVYQTN